MGARQRLRRPLPSGSCSAQPHRSFASGKFSLFLKIFPGVRGAFQGGCMRLRPIGAQEGGNSLLRFVDIYSQDL